VLFFGYRREQPGTSQIKLAGITMPQHDAIAYDRIALRYGDAS